MFAMTLCGLMLMSGCSAPTDKEKVNAADQAGKKVLTFALGGELDNLSPLIMNGLNQGAHKLVFEGLVNYENGKIIPGLAESWEFSEGGKRLTFHLRPGVTFHNGEPFNAHAVKTNLEFFNSNPNHSFLRGVSTIEKIEALDENTLSITYPAPYFAVLNDFCAPDVMVMVSPQTIEEGNYVTLNGTVGTGPYRYEEFKKGEYTRFTRYDSYWGPKPVYDEVIAKYIPESASRLKALQTGEIDIIFGSIFLSYDDYMQATSIPGIKGQVSENDIRTRNIAANASGEMLADIKLRQAVAHAIDKQTISEGLTYGHETPAVRLFPDGTPYSEVKLNNIWDYDVETAGSLLDQAGWKLNPSTGVREKDGKTLSLLFIYEEGVALNKEIATTIKSQLAEVGIAVEIQGMEQMQWWKESYSGNYDLVIWTPPSPYSLPHNHFTGMLDSSAEMAAITKMADVEQVNAAIHEYLTTADTERVTEIFDYLLNYINDNVIDIPLTYTKELVVYNSEKIDSYTFSGLDEFFDIRGLESK